MYQIITPIKDIDIYCVLPFLDVKEIHFILCTHRDVSKEYLKRLVELKYDVFREIRYFKPSELANIKYFLQVNDETEKAYHSKHPEDVIKNQNVIKIDTFNLKIDTNNIPYLRIKYKDQLCQHSIYDRSIRLLNENVAVYCLDKLDK